MGETIKVGIAEYKICKKPDKISTIGLGSCVGVVLYNDTSDYCGLLHIMLPSRKEISNDSKRAKCADTGIEDMIKDLVSLGMKKDTMVAKIAGGATMFQFSMTSETKSIGDRNVQSVKEELAKHHIRIISSDCGADYGRTIVFDLATKQLLIRAAGKPEKSI